MEVEKIEKKSFWDSFFAFEERNNLFELQDSQGTYYWDIIRSEIYLKLLHKNTSISIKSNKRKNFRFILKRILDFIKIYLFFSKKKYLFFIASRYKNAEGVFFDQAIKNVYETFGEKEKLTIESYSYGIYNSYFNPALLYRKMFVKKKMDLSFLINLLVEEFGELNFDENYLNSIIKNYYADVSFYKRILKKNKVEKIFINQNGIQKGLIKAGKILNITIYECQHGSVDIGHSVYSYPNVDFKDNQVILPDAILSLSPFWFNELNLPKVNIYPIGNDYFYGSLVDIESEYKYKKAITIISADVFGSTLSEFILKEDTIEYFKDTIIYFKLHPNQYEEKKKYEQIFFSCQNIKVITNEKSVGELLKQSQSVFLIVSTVAYEALQMDKKVIVLKKDNYLEMEHIFNQPNLYLVETTSDFIKALQTEIKKDVSPMFFMPFDRKKFLELFGNNGAII